VPFRGYIEGTAQPTHRRVTTCQRCVRDKDTDQVGIRIRYLTFFEMLGNFSFGDYYKRESMLWGWEFLTQVMKFPVERLWGTVYEKDDEGVAIWEREIGMPGQRVVPLGMDNNWWGPLAEVGACGPCAEFYYDLGPELGCGRAGCKPGCECDRFLEIWNMVFTEFYRNADGSFSPLASKNIDTGMGLERTALCAQDKPTVYAIDVFTPLVEAVASMASRREEPERAKVHTAVVADHARAYTMMIADGMLPGNEGRGYVLRRFMRRAMVAGRRLGIEKPFLAELPPLVADALCDFYPQLKPALDHIVRACRLEEERFREVLETGWNALREEIDHCRRNGERAVSAEVAFRLHDTYGFPIELTQEMAAEEGLGVDEAGFARAMEGQRARSRQATVVTALGEKGYGDFLQRHGKTEFVGYESLAAEARILAVFREGEPTERATEGEVDIVLDRTPFYAEAGGQVGDTGLLTGSEGQARVTGAFYGAEALVVHRCALDRGSLRPGEQVTACVDEARRQAIRRAHTATHLLHHALHQVLGKHAVQSGSLVEPDLLRFDFSHQQAVSAEQLRQIEALVNGRVREDAPVSVRRASLQQAKAEGAMALFGEKYGEVVRVVEVGGFSQELCGGTHLSRTGEIGLFHIVGQESVGAGLRRVAAVTGQAAMEAVWQAEDTIDRIAKAVGAGSREEGAAKVEALLAALKDAQQEVARCRERLAGMLAAQLVERAETVDGVQVIVEAVPASEKAVLAELCDAVGSHSKEAVVLLAAADAEEVALACKVSQATAKRGLSAGDLVREAAQALGGKGGGKPTFARGRGTEAAKVNEVLRQMRERIRQGLAGRT
jgi:alanyl-tRNA synthetase